MTKKRGRPSKYTKALGDKICQQLILGDSLRTICRQPDMPALSTVCLWLAKPDEYVEFSEQYTQARAVQAELMADEIHEIADDGTNDWMERHNSEGDVTGVQFNSEHVQRSKLRIDARKWTASKLLPKRYGDKLTNIHEGGERPIRTETHIIFEGVGAD